MRQMEQFAPEEWTEHADRCSLSGSCRHVLFALITSQVVQRSVKLVVLLQPTLLLFWFSLVALSLCTAHAAVFCEIYYTVGYQQTRLAASQRVNIVSQHSNVSALSKE